MAAKETENNTCSKFGGDKKKELYGMLWYFLEWSIDSITTCLAHAPKKCTQSGNFQFDINSPFENTVYPKTKDAFPKIQAWAYSRYSHLHRSCLRNIREFKMSRQLTATKTSHEKWTRIFFSLYRDYSNSLTLSNARELFWSWISINHSQVHREKENFVIACLRPS